MYSCLIGTSKSKQNVCNPNCRFTMQLITTLTDTQTQGAPAREVCHGVRLRNTVGVNEMSVCLLVSRLQSIGWVCQRDVGWSGRLKEWIE